MTIAETSESSESARHAHTEETLLERRRRLLGPAYRLFYEKPVHLVRGEGVWLYDAHGTPYLDAYNNVACVGHCHPEVVAALARQAAQLNTHTRYLHEDVVDYAERLLASFPVELAHVMFTCSGSEANDLALRVARACTGGSGIVVTQFAYHGVTSALAELSPSLGAHAPLGSHVRTVPMPVGQGPEAGRDFAAHVGRAIEDMRQAGIRPAALLLDTAFSSDGVYTDPAGFVAEAVATMRAAGGVFIADEVQAGFGRMGSHMWGFQRHGVVPDMVTLGKPMGNGHPMAGMVCRSQLLREFGERCRYFNTFGGNPVSANVGMAVLDVIEREGLQENAGRVGRHLKAGLARLAERHALIGDIRGEGLFVGIELVRDRAARTPAPTETTRIVNALRERGVLIGAAGIAGNVLKVRPPLPFSEAHADIFLARLDEVLADGVSDRSDAL